jgi:hypothetical protein
MFFIICACTFIISQFGTFHIIFSYWNASFMFFYVWPALQEILFNWKTGLKAILFLDHFISSLLLLVVHFFVWCFRRGLNFNNFKSIIIFFFFNGRFEELKIWFWCSSNLISLLFKVYSSSISLVSDVYEDSPLSTTVIFHCTKVILFSF